MWLGVEPHSTQFRPHKEELGGGLSIPALCPLAPYRGGDIRIRSFQLGGERHALGLDAL